MIVVPMSWMSLACGLTVWALDSFLFLVALRVVLSASARGRSSHCQAALRQLTDPAVVRVEQWLSGHVQRPAPTWAPWLTVMVTVTLARSALMWVVAAAS